VILLVATSFAQKEAPLPPDLPPYGPEKPLQAPAVSSNKLDNGLTVWLVSEPGFPKVAFQVAIRGGFAADSADRPGISELLAATVDQGTKSRDAKQIAQELQASGGDFSAMAEKDSVEISTSVLSSKVENGLSVLSDILQNASFPDAEVSLAKRNLSDSLRQQESDPSFLANRALQKALFGDHPYHVNSPTQESIAAATPGDLRSIYRQRFRPDQAIVVVAGDFENARMLELMRSKLSGWTNPSEPSLSLPAPPSAMPAHNVYLVPRPGSVQTTFRLATFGPLRGDADYEAAEVANAIYGGTFSSRLVSNIREDKGYTYTPFSGLRAYRQAGTLITGADVRNEVTAPTLNEIMYELNRLATTSPTDEELSKAKRYLVGDEALDLQARSAVVRQLASLWVDNLPPDHIATSNQKLSGITKQDVDTAAKKYFPAAQTLIVAVGEEKVVREALAPFDIPIQTVP
jgi:zinc protease